MVDENDERRKRIELFFEGTGEITVGRVATILRREIQGERERFAAIFEDFCTSRPKMTQAEAYERIWSGR